MWSQAGKSAGRVWRGAAVTGLVLLTGCGGGGGGGGTGPSQTTRSLVISGNFSQLVGTPTANLAGYTADVAVSPFTTSASGTLEITVDWTFSANDLDILLYNGNCPPASALAGSCPILNRTSSTTAKPERLNVSGVPAGTYTLGIANFGLTTESGTYQVFLVR
ncbi:MAG: hypothetical protein HY317_04740 [Acidobacteria bacterium]|nr:hypothetical protein [Acidobacteriota bacterium]